jgi:uncharacterized membrane protein
MARTSADHKAEIITVRVPSALKAAFAEIAQQESKPLGELLRELIRERIERKRRREFEADARRQSLEAAVLARDPNSDEAAVMRELEADLEEFGKEWK